MASLVRRYGRRERFLHWCHLGSTFLLFVTGASWYFPALADFLGGYAVVRVMHRLGAVVFISAPFLVAASDVREARSFFQEILSWSREDLYWLARFPRYQLSGGKTPMPSVEGKYTPGQKLNGILVLLLCGSLALGGAFWWFLPPGLPDEAVAFLRGSHRLASAALLILIFGHTLISSGVFPVYRGVYRTMFGDGRISRKRAGEIWPGWNAEQEEPGDRRE